MKMDEIEKRFWECPDPPFPATSTPIITNYDRIISKAPEEMADWLCKILTYCSNRHCDPDCPLFKCCHDQPTDNIEGWLKSPVDKEGE